MAHTDKVAGILAAYDTWNADRARLSAREGTDDPPRPSEWERSDDAATVLAHGLADVLRAFETEPEPVRVWSLTHIADWEGGVTLYASHASLWQQVEADAQDAARISGLPVPADSAHWEEFIEEHGWKIQRYMIEEHVLTLA